MNIPGKDLISQLEEITARKPEANVNFEDIEIIEEKKAEVNPDDFDYNSLNNLSMDSETAAAEAIPARPELPPPTFQEYKEEAIQLIGFFNGLSCLILPGLYRRKLLSRDEYIRAKTLLKRIKRDKDAETSFTPEEFEIYEKLLQIDEYEETLSFSEKETEMIAQPLAELMQKYARKTSPEARLIFALGTVLIPRSLVFFAKT